MSRGEGGDPNIDTRRLHGKYERTLVRVGEIRCKTLMGRSGIGSVDYSINPYLGCAHGCVYCYARFMRRMGHAGEEWGSFVDAKVNALERLRREAPRRRMGKVLLSSVTDPYQPLERKYELTRGCLQLLLERQFPVSILTKSDLVLRDLDLLKKFDRCEVGFTITALGDVARSAFEPGASPVEARLQALRELNEEGITTWTFLGPVLPYLTDEGLETLINELARSVSRILVDRLNIKCGNMPSIRRALSAHYPDLQPLFEAALKEGGGYYGMFRKKVTDMCRQRLIPCEIVF
ncbi:MAG: radical SAM protein [Candidatus Bathyarchaeota archaeon]|nr:MAG: radical SAM protein [Candidatus Bathyarchaeota archaeon]